MSLQGRVAIVTGASRGIGRACARALAGAGARVVVAARSVRDRERLPGTVHSVAAEIAAAGGEALAIACDLRDRGQIGALVGRTVEHFGRLDILVNNAGALFLQPVLRTPPKRLDLVMQVNLEGTFLLCQEAVPHMRAGGWGHIINMSPPPDLEKLPGRTAYLVSKYGMTMIALGLAGELREENIGVNCLWPATLIDSQATRNWGMGEPSQWRKPDILADAVLAIVAHPPEELTGRMLLDEPFLRSQGVVDFDRYSVVPGATIPPLDDFWDALSRDPGTEP